MGNCKYFYMCYVCLELIGIVSIDLVQDNVWNHRGGIHEIDFTNHIGILANLEGHFVDVQAEGSDEAGVFVTQRGCSMFFVHLNNHFVVIAFQEVDFRYDASDTYFWTVRFRS